jgi:prolyl oligopeptidase
MEVTREFATSRDGTQIPFTILHRRGVPLNHATPTIMTGYGGFGLSEEPAFDVGQRILLDAGVSWVDTNIRGGGDYGEAWHRAGSLLDKQHTFDDFIACAERMIELGYTSPEHLVIEGSSEGGLLMGAAMTQRPDLFKAVVSDVGLYDMLRAEQSPNGVFNTTETGTVANVDQFHALYAYSPYHHVHDGSAYPDALFLIGAVDPRVDPMHSRKMVARLQAAEGGKGMVLLRASSSDGHGTHTAFSEQVEQDADILAFEFRELGVQLPSRSAR